MEKYVRDSYTEHVQILSQSSLNGYKRLFGGRLMEWIDVVAGVCLLYTSPSPRDCS